MLISVGGAEAPIIWSINHHSPEKIIFFVSKSSRKQVSEKIMPAIFNVNQRFIDHEFIITPDEQDIGESTRILLNQVPKAMHKMALSYSWPDIVDYTGGTKTMSAAMVWASSKFPCYFSYIGADTENARNKGGLGIVMDGREKCLIQENPWNKLAYFEINDAIKLFNRGQYANAADILAGIADKVTEQRHHRVFAVLRDIVKGYASWDIFDHQTAQRLIGKNFKALADIAETERFYLPNLKQTVETVQINLEFLNQIKPHKLSWFMIHDLLANALRRAELEKKYEDATARVYSSIEKIAKYQLQLKYGINNSQCPKHRVPEQLYSEYTAKYNSNDDTLQFGVIASFRMLQAFDDIYGKRFFARPHIMEHLTERNYSILGHGTQTISQKSFNAIFDDAIALLKIDKDSLPLFPRL